MLGINFLSDLVASGMFLDGLFDQNLEAVTDCQIGVVAVPNIDVADADGRVLLFCQSLEEIDNDGSKASVQRSWFV